MTVAVVVNVDDLVQVADGETVAVSVAVVDTDGELDTVPDTVTVVV